jgi:CheY-like chemotaxis protein
VILQVRAGELIDSLQKIQTEGFTGIADFEGVTDRQRVLRYSFAFKNGAITYAGKRILSPLQFANWMQKRMKLTHLQSTLKVVSTRTKNEESVRELLDFIVRFGLVKWEDLEAVMQVEIASVLEYILPFAGTLSNRSATEFDLCYGEDHHGLDFARIKSIYANRQRSWNALDSEISLNTIPIMRLDAGLAIPDIILPHLNKWASGKFNLSEIAGGCGEDPLQLAQAYLIWSKQGWVRLRNIMSEAPAKVAEIAIVDQRPIILSVDDSKIVQVSIRKSVGDLYNVMFASNAMEALSILNSYPITLLLLDVTMPDIDGLELCRTIRNITKFKNLPIVMVTAKDGIIDKMKGQFAGSTYYLNKPVDREKLLPVLEKYIVKVPVTK